MIAGQVVNLICHTFICLSYMRDTDGRKGEMCKGPMRSQHEHKLHTFEHAMRGRKTWHRACATHLQVCHDWRAWRSEFQH